MNKIRGKTAEQCFDMLEEPFCSQAKANSKLQPEFRPKRKFYVDSSEAILREFQWLTTPLGQGYGYWNAIVLCLMSDPQSIYLKPQFRKEQNVVSEVIKTKPTDHMELTKEQKEKFVELIKRIGDTAHFGKINSQDLTQESLRFKNDLGFDSLDLVELVMDAEKAFDIVIADDLWMDVETIGDAHRAISKSINKPIQEK